MEFLIDTNVFLNVLKSDEPQKQIETSFKFFELIKKKKIDIFISPIVITELMRLPIRNKDIEEQHKVEMFLQTIGIKILKFGHKEGVEAAKLIEENKINFADALVAAPAKTHKIAVLVTRNKRDYKNSGLRVLLPEEASKLL